MGLAKHKKLSKSEYDSLSTKDEDTIYAVNVSGDFSEENLEDTAELFIGDKKIANDIPYGECNVSPSTVEKLVTTLNGNFKLKQGAEISVKFYQGHTAPTMTLNVDGTGAKSVFRDGNSPKNDMIKGYNVYKFVYDGTYWRIVGVDTDTTYSLATTSSLGLMSSTDKIKLNGIDLSKYLPLAGGTVTGEFKTNALTHLANSTSAVLQAFPESEASGFLSTAIGYRSKVSGNYSTAIGYLCQNFGNDSAIIGYGSFNGRRSADTSKPYITMTYFRPLSIIVKGVGVYGVNIPKGESVSYIYNDVEYTAENTNTTYTAILVVIENATKDILDVPITYASIYNSKQNYGNMKILSITEISDTIFAVVLNGQGSTLSDNLYRSYVALPIKTNSSLYSGQGSVNCGYSTDSTGRFSFTAGQLSINGSANSIINGSFNYTGGSYINVFGQNNTVITYNGSFVAGNYNFVSASSFISGNNNLAVQNNTKILGHYNITTTPNQVIIGNYNNTNSNSLFIIANGTSNTNRKNIFTISDTGVLYVYDNIIPSVGNKDIGSTSSKWRNIYADNFKGNADTATKVNNVLTIKKGSTTDTFDGSATKTIDITDLQNIGNLNNLQTSNKSNLVDAINEVNTKANNSTGGTVNDSTISPFAGFLPDNATIIDSSFNSTNGEVLYDSATNRFIWKDLSGAFIQYYANWGTSYLYNTTSDSSTSAKDDKLFSYNDKHYMVINGTLQNISALDNNGNMTTAGIVKLSDSYTGGADNYGVDSGIAATPKAVANLATAARNYATTQADNALNLAKSYSDNNLTTAENYSDNKSSQTLESANQYTDSKATQVLTSANNYTDNQISAKIQLVTALPSNPISDVLYLIQET